MEDFLLHLQNLHREKSPEIDELIEEYKIECLETDDIQDMCLDSFEEAEVLQQEDNQNFSCQEDSEEGTYGEDQINTSCQEDSEEETFGEDQIDNSCQEGSEEETYGKDQINISSQEDSDEEEGLNVLKTDVEVSNKDEINKNIQNYDDDDDSDEVSRIRNLFFKLKICIIIPNNKYLL